MTVHVYDTPTAPDHMIKDLNTVVSPQDGWSGAVRGEISIEHPVITVEASVQSGNYCYIPDFGRYYWITDKNLVRRDLTELSLESDPLMSFATDIAALPIVVSRTSRDAVLDTDPGCNAYLADRQQPMLVPTIQDVHVLHEFASDSYLLLVVG